MKAIIITGIAVLLFGFSQFSSKQKGTTGQYYNDTTLPGKKQSRQNKNAPYDLPDNITTDTGKASFLKSFKKGRIIYTQTCAKCHDSTKNGKKFYPDFSLPQLMDYEMRFQYPEHQEDLRETNITAEELDDVVIFLRYKKKELAVSK